MNLAGVERIAEAVLYEGYMLYPYRASAIKNRQRWNFGVLSPRSYCEVNGGANAWMMQTECLLEADATARLDIEIRFLQIVNRAVGMCAPPLDELPVDGEPKVEFVQKLSVGDRDYVPWQEAIERKVAIPALRPAASSYPQHSCFEFPARRELEPVCGRDGKIEGVIVREQAALAGSVEVSLQSCRDGLIKVQVCLPNLTADGNSQLEGREEALMHSLVSAHTILGVDNGRFVSLLEPADDLKDWVAKCTNIGTWPVLVGEHGSREAMLSSPIILYDYPEIAPESPGSLFDGTEIDEILSLRILTMTEEEKREIRQGDDRTRQILERTEHMPPEQFIKLHGVMRGLRTLSGEAL
jgi:hydrogenase maturation protease